MMDGPAPKPRPNYARIARLERELGLAESEEPAAVTAAGVTADEALKGIARLGETIRATRWP